MNPTGEAEKCRTVWASFDWVKQVDLETALEQQRRLSEPSRPVVRLVVKWRRSWRS